MLLELFELLQLVQEVEFPFLMCVNMVHADAIGLVRILLAHVLTLDLVEHGELLHVGGCTLSFSLNERDSSSTL